MDNPLTIRPATEQDCRLLWEWANDPAVRRSAFHSDPIGWEEHVAWFRRKMRDPQCSMYILIAQGGLPIGQVRFDLHPDDGAEVDISIAKAQRCRRYGREGLRMACERLFQDRGVARITASIKSENAASIRTFEHAGFVSQGSVPVKGHEAIRVTLQQAPRPATRRAGRKG